MTDPFPSLLDAALALHDAGLCVLPAAEDGSKRPAVAWQQYQQQRPTVDQLRAWFADGRTGLGVVAGAVSGGVELTEIEGRAAHDGALKRLFEFADAAGERELLDRLLSGYAVASPSGGLHIVYRLLAMAVPGNTKLASTAGHVTLAETRGEGGWFVTAPSFGSTHPTKRPWSMVAGGPASIPTITADERERFHALVRLLDERPLPEPTTPAVFAPLSKAGGTDGVSPGDDFAERTSWDELLTGAGWRRAFARGEVTYWTRPGKTQGVSASTGWQGDWLYVFTSSTEFEPERTYTKFGAYALLDHHGDHQAAAKALQARGYGKAPTAVSLPVPRPTVEVVDGGVVDTETGEVELFQLNDYGNARLLVAAHGDRMRYCPERGTWLVWNGAAWTWDEGGQHMELVKDTFTTAQRLATDDRAQKHYHRSLNRRPLESAIALARTDPRVIVRIDALDAHDDQLSTPGGTVDLRTGELRAADRAELHTQQALVTPKAMATPMWDQFLADTYGYDRELLAFMQRLLGYCITGDVGEHILPFLYGEGRNGKSVLIGVLVRLLGDYGTTAPGSFLTQGYQQHETEIARLVGKRVVGCAETEKGAKFAEAKVKMLTGGDRVTARFMRQDHFTFRATAKLTLMANDRPTVASGGDSFWRRVALIPHPHQVPPERRIANLEDRLIAEEGPGILAWLIEGARAYYRDGLHRPAAVRAATAEYAEAEDDLGRFIAERLIVPEPHLRSMAQTPTSAVTATYLSWCRDEGVEPLTLKRFGLELRRRCNVEAFRAGGRRFYLGISLADTGPTFSVLTPDHLH